MIEIFNNISRKEPITSEKAQIIITEVLRNVGIVIEPHYWPYLLKFAEKDGIIDYKFMFEVYKERINRIYAHPKANKIIE